MWYDVISKEGFEVKKFRSIFPLSTAFADQITRPQ